VLRLFVASALCVVLYAIAATVVAAYGEPSLDHLVTVAVFDRTPLLLPSLAVIALTPPT
jgi:hypothetical protein